MGQGLSGHILNMPRLLKRAIALSVDSILCIATVAVAYFLRLDQWHFPVGTQWLSYAAAILFALPLFINFGLYRAIFRYVGWGALMAVVRACALYGFIYSFVFTVAGVDTVPRSIGLLQPILLFLAIGSTRAIARYWLGGGYRQLLKLGQRRRVLIYGAGSAGRQLAAALEKSDDMIVVAYVDDDPSLENSVLNGKRIYGPRRLAEHIIRLEINDVLLAIPSATRQRRNDIIEGIRNTPATIRTLPGMNDLAHGRVTVNDLRELDIDDLLGRETVSPNQVLLSKNVTGKTVLVSGAGGSIGSELCRQIAVLRPARLLLFEQSEFNLYSIDQEFERRQSELGFDVVSLLGSVQDRDRVNAVIGTWKPDTIYHAAAYKHVPLVEYNPAEGVRNNVFGTLTLATAALEQGVHDFVLISTDKAVRPTNVMGATKRLAEMVLQALAHKSSSTRFSMVRFGNVLGSSGSVVPLFRRQIRDGGPVTITHEEVTRYFMTIPEAAQLVIQAGAMANGGEVFVLDMGSPVKIVDLARRMIELSGLQVRDKDCPDGDIEISVVGLRPGEKLYEELLIGENPQPTRHPRIVKATDGFLEWPLLDVELKALWSSLTQGDAGFVRERLMHLVPDFKPENMGLRPSDGQRALQVPAVDRFMTQ